MVSQNHRFIYSYRVTIILLIGTTDYSKPIDSLVWINAMINESESPGKFFSDEFKDWSDAVLDEIGLTQEDITP